MKLSLMRVAVYALTFALGGMFCVVVSGEQPNQAPTCLHACTDKEGDRVRAMHSELAGTRGNPAETIRDSKPPIVFTKPAPDSVFTVGPILDCSHGSHPKLVIGNNVVVIDECTGAVRLNDPDVDVSSLKFWQAVQRAWPMVCAKQPKAPKK